MALNGKGMYHSGSYGDFKRVAAMLKPRNAQVRCNHQASKSGEWIGGIQSRMAMQGCSLVTLGVGYAQATSYELCVCSLDSVLSRYPCACARGVPSSFVVMISFLFCTGSESISQWRRIGRMFFVLKSSALGAECGLAPAFRYPPARLQ